MLVDRLHDLVAGERRKDVLAGLIGELLPRDSVVLDIGSGNGALSWRIAKLRPDCSFSGLDVLVPPETRIPVSPFDGQTIPMGSASVDVAMLIDVLHHTPDPAAMLAEARRVARRCIVIKDHRRDGFLAGPLLRIMDWVGNAHHGVSLPYNYWSEQQWRAAFLEKNLTVEIWKTNLGIHSAFLDPIVGRGLHFLARLTLSPAS